MAELTKRQRMAAVVRALLAKTSEAGATEAEATAAAEKARELMDRFHIEQGELGMEAEGTGQRRAAAHKFGRLILSDYISRAVAAFCDCKSWRSPGRADGRHAFFGLRSDTEFAAWLLDSLSRHITNALQAERPQWRHMHGRERWGWQKAFLMGAAGRIHDRLDKLTAERKAAQEAAARDAAAGPLFSGGRALVLVKSAIVERDFKALGVRLSGRSAGVNFSGGSGYAAGKAAGDRATFGRPVNGGGGAVRHIGQGLTNV